MCLVIYCSLSNAPLFGLLPTLFCFRGLVKSGVAGVAEDSELCKD
jgi:hypothetical protein